MTSRIGALNGLARRVMAPHHAMPKRGGGGGPLKLGRPIDHPLPEEDELLWDDGTANPEPCLDVFPLTTTWQAAGYCATGLSVYAIVAGVLAWSDKASKQPYAPREYPYDNLRVELGGDPDESSEGGEGIISKLKSKLPFTTS